MLKSLTVTNFALIEHAVVGFNEGLNILTGETGAGKSILIDALSAVLGSRLSVDMIRTSCEYLRIEAVFDITHITTIASFLAEKDIITDEDNTLIISRRLSQHGKNTIMVNSCQITLTTLRQLGEKLIDIHGQHEHQALLRTDSYLSIIDNYEASIKQDVGLYRDLFHAWCAIKKQITDIKEHSLEYTQRMDMLSWQVQEISAAQLAKGEDETLEKEVHILSNAEKISSAVNKAYVLFEQGSKGIGGIIQALAEAKKELEIAQRYDQSLKKNSLLITDMLYQIQDCSSELRDYLDGFEFNPKRLMVLQERLDVLDKLKRKYNMDIEGLLAYCDKAIQEINVITNHEQTLSEMTEKLVHMEEKLRLTAEQLSVCRKKAASDFTNKVQQHLSDLGMPQASFIAKWTTLPNFSITGIDEILFMLSANPGEEPKPLYKVASGGELSRIALAIKTVSAQHDEIGTMIFDEVDAGIGGQTAQMVADKIALVALNRQVICITHSPTIACMADSHMLIEKFSDGLRTKTIIRLLDENNRLLEIGRMISGNKITQAAKDNAFELLYNAKQKKELWKKDVQS